jgi:uncharacterized protein
MHASGQVPVQLTRRQWLGVTAGACIAAIGVHAIGIEPNRVTITRHAVGGGDGPLLRVVQLSDMHLRAIGRHEARVAEAVHALDPALLVLTGDAIDRADALPLLAEFLHMLPASPTRLAILGNWEHWARVDLAQLTDIYERAGWTLLRNTSRRLSVQHAELLITGLDDLIGGQPDVAGALADAKPCANHLLLAHCPTHREAFAETARAGPAGAASPDLALRTPQLMLAGHTHGGQFALGTWAPVRPPGSGRYVAGWYRDASTALYVSRGIGTSIVPARVGAPPEIAVFDWTLAI